MKLLYILTGYYNVTVSHNHADCMLQKLRASSVVFSDYKITSDATTFQISAKDKSKLGRVIYDIPHSFSKLCGLPGYIVRYKNRIHIPILTVLFVCLLLLSQSIIWDIRVYGNENVSSDKIIQLLKNLDFHIGSSARNINLDRLHNQFLLASDNISWISVNIDGVVANVEVREYRDGVTDHPLDTAPRNIVASADGQIAMITVEAGKKVVEVGQTVKKGELLISGIIDSQSQGARYEHASGCIYAYVNKQINVDIPLNVTEKHYTGGEYKNISLDFFGKTINIFPNSRNLGANCDRIIEKHRLVLFGRFAVPVTIITEKFYEYTEDSRTLTLKEGTELAMAELSASMNELLASAELISKTISTQYEKDTIRVYCTLYCLENIAEPLEFKLS